MNSNVARVNRRGPQPEKSALRRIVVITLVIMGIHLFCRPVWATSYECVDRAGKVIYTDNPEPAEKCSVIELLMATPPKSDKTVPPPQGMPEPGFGRSNYPPPRAMPYDGNTDSEEPSVQQDNDPQNQQGFSPQNPPINMAPD